MIKIDKIDIKILKELLYDSSQQLSTIGKKVRLSRENVHYRIENLIKKQVIKSFITIVDYPLLGYSQYTLFLELDKINEIKEKFILDYLSQNNKISWIGILAGKWSLTFDIYVKDISELNDFVEKLSEKFNENIREYKILHLIKSDYYFNKLIDEKVIEYNKRIMKKIKIDHVDKEILNMLNISSRTSYVDISIKANLTPNAIKQRIKNLERGGIIKKYSISINHKAFDYDWHGLQIKLLMPLLKIENDLINYLKNDKRVIFYYNYDKLSNYDFDVGIIMKNSSELRLFINKLRSSFYDKIKIIDTFVVLEEISSHNLPEIIFE